MFILSVSAIAILIIMTHVSSTNSLQFLTSGFDGCDFMVFRRHRYRCLFHHTLISAFHIFVFFFSLRMHNILDGFLSCRINIGSSLDFLFFRSFFVLINPILLILTTNDDDNNDQKFFVLVKNDVWCWIKRNFCCCFGRYDIQWWF